MERSNLGRMRACNRRSTSNGTAVLAALAAICALSACDRKPEVTCASPDATSTTITVLKDALVKQVFSKLSNGDSQSAISKANVRAAVAQLAFSFEDLRTTRQDPNSTKRFCEGTLKVRFPAEYLTNAEDARSAAGVGTVTQLADANDVDREADTFSAKADYDVQPTDSGDKVFSETEVGSPLMNVVTEVLASSLLHNIVQSAAAQAQQQQQALQAQQTAALAEQKAANLNSAKTDDQLANQAILAVWRAVTPAARAQLLAQQRAWARKKDADCRVEAASASTDPTEMEVARLTCDGRVTQERIAYLQHYRDQGTDASSPSGDDGGSDD